jgi:phosphatidate cytidylyltransferase
LAAKSCTWLSRNSAGALAASADSRNSKAADAPGFSFSYRKPSTGVTSVSGAASAAGAAERLSTPARRPGRGRELALRFLTAFVAVPLLIGIAYLGNPLYGLFIPVATAYAAFEVRAMLRAGGHVPIGWLLIGLSALLPLNAWVAGFWPSAPDALSLVVFLAMAGLVSLLFRPTSSSSLVDWALSVGLALYLGGLMQFYLPLRAFPSPVPGFWVIALMVLSWVSDSAAYFVGSAIGRTPLAPSVSPKKSVEGAIAGLVAPAAVAPLIGLLLGLPPLLMAGYGLCIAFATIVGDLIESLIKRQTGVKDSGIMMPGHGGLLDRMDSLLVCAPVAVLYLHAFLP